MSASFFSKCSHFPMRLDQKERVYLELLRGALDTSEYTDKVDVVSYYRKDNTIKSEIEELLAIISGLMLASNFRLGENLIAGKRLQDNESFFQKVFEVGRRYKISNVDKVRLHLTRTRTLPTYTHTQTSTHSTDEVRIRKDDAHVTRRIKCSNARHDWTLSEQSHENNRNRFEGRKM
jgi:hypothetical protein